MKKLSIYLLLLFFVPTIIFTGCKDDETVEPSIQVLTKYLSENGKDLPAILLYNADGTDIKFVTAAPATDADVPAFIENKYIMDIRSAADFAAGHITGAHNVAFSDILTEASNSGSKRILVVCYTGQTACYAASLLRLYGYPDAQALKWGMSGWNAQFDKWTSNCSDIAASSNNWSTATAPQNVKYDAPVLSESSTDGATILKQRVEAVVAAGFKTLSSSDVLESPANYFINNYFSEADYTAFGHIDGAHRILPLSIADDLIYYLDPSKKIVTYCYTGQTSAVITAYLNVLGYDAYSLLFGMNGLYNSNSAWVSNQWGGDSNPKNLSTVTN